MRVTCKCGATTDTQYRTERVTDGGTSKSREHVFCKCPKCGKEASSGGFGAAIDHLEKSVKEKMSA